MRKRAPTTIQSIADTGAADAIDLNFKYIFHVSLFRRLSCMGRPPVKSAILVASDVAVHYAKLHALLTQGSPIQVRIFEDLDQAAKWLDVPIQLLSM